MESWSRHCNIVSLSVSPGISLESNGIRVVEHKIPEAGEAPQVNRVIGCEASSGRKRKEKI